MTIRNNQEDTDDICDDILNAVQGWCFSGILEIEEQTNLLRNHGGEGLRASTDSIRMDDGDGILSREMGTNLDLEGISNTTLQAMWTQHLYDDKDENNNNPTCRRRGRGFERQESISTLEETGVGSYAHLNMLSSEQLQDMEKMVQEHDGRYWGNGPGNGAGNELLSFEWLDSICA